MSIYSDIAGDIALTVKPDVFKPAYSLQLKQQAAKAAQQKAQGQEKQKRKNEFAKMISKGISLDPSKYHPDVMPEVIDKHTEMVKQLYDYSVDPEKSNANDLLQSLNQYNQFLNQAQQKSKIGFWAEDTRKNPLYVTMPNSFEGLGTGNAKNWKFDPLTTGAIVDDENGVYQVGNPVKVRNWGKDYTDALSKNKDAFGVEGEIINLPFGRKKEFLSPDKQQKLSAFFTVVDSPESLRDYLANRVASNALTRDEAMGILQDQDNILSGAYLAPNGVQTNPLADKFFKDVDKFTNQYSVSAGYTFAPSGRSGGGSPEEFAAPSGSMVPSVTTIPLYNNRGENSGQSVLNTGTSIDLQQKGGLSSTGISQWANQPVFVYNQSNGLLSGKRFGKIKRPYELSGVSVTVKPTWKGQPMEYNGTVIENGQPLSDKEIDYIKTNYPQSVKGIVPRYWIDGSAKWQDEVDEGKLVTKTDLISVPFNPETKASLINTFKVSDIPNPKIYQKYYDDLYKGLGVPTKTVEVKKTKVIDMNESDRKRKEEMDKKGLKSPFAK